MKNAKWTRDEIIIALDFYHKNYPSIPDGSSDKIQELSNTIRKLQIILDGDINQTFRNTNGVYMKLMNFHHFNPNHSGDGLGRGSKLDKEIFKEFENDLELLSQISNSIIENLNSNESFEIIDDDGEIEYSAREGKLLTRLHRYRERDSKVTKKKKDKVLLEEGKLECEGCGFNFKKKYGLHGDGFIECHHTKPLSEIVYSQKTKLSDLSLVCSNCHRMIHRHRPWLTMEQLRGLLE